MIWFLVKKAENEKKIYCTWKIFCLPQLHAPLLVFKELTDTRKPNVQRKSVYFKKTIFALKTYWFSLLSFFHPNHAAHNSYLARVLWRHFVNRLYCATSSHSAKVRVVSTFIWIKQKNKTKNWKIVIIQIVCLDFSLKCI